MASYAVLLAGGLLVLRPGSARDSLIGSAVMLAPTAGALLAWWRTGERIQVGRPGLRALLGLLTPVPVLLATLAVVPLGVVTLHADRLPLLLLLAPVHALTGSLTAVFEEIGWRGFLWPTLRGRLGFWVSALVTAVAWWAYHLPAVLLLGFGWLGGLPAFALSLLGLSLVAGVLTDRSRSVWGAVLSHGSWNGVVALGFYAGFGGDPTPCAPGCPRPPPFASAHGVFSGPATALGELGWVAALSVLLFGVVLATWHVQHPTRPARPRRD